MAKFWVTMTDNFMSGWGKAEGKRAKFVIRCETAQEAYQIKAAADRRPEMRYVNVRVTKPRYDARRFQVTVRDYADLGDVWKH